MAESSSNHRSLRSRGPNGRVAQTNSATNGDNGGSNHSSNGETSTSNSSALNRLLSPLPAASQRATFAGGMGPPLPPPQLNRLRDMRPISAWQPQTRSLGEPSTLDAASADPDDEGEPEDAHSRSVPRGQSGTSQTEPSDDEQDGRDPLLASAFFLEGTPYELDAPAPDPPTSRVQRVPSTQGECLAYCLVILHCWIPAGGHCPNLSFSLGPHRVTCCSRSGLLTYSFQILLCALASHSPPVVAEMACPSRVMSFPSLAA